MAEEGGETFNWWDHFVRQSLYKLPLDSKVAKEIDNGQSPTLISYDNMSLLFTYRFPNCD